MLLIGQNRVMLTRTGTPERAEMIAERDRLRNALRSRIRELIEEARKDGYGKLRVGNSSLSEALNSGNGTYKP